MSGRFTRQRGEQIQTDIEKKRKQYRSRRIDEAIERGYEHLWDGNLPALIKLMRDILISDMGVTRHTIRDHSRKVREQTVDLPWDHESVRRFVEDPDRYLRTFSPGKNGENTPTTDQLYLKAAGMKDPRERRRETISKAFHSLESLAVARGYVSNSVTNHAPAFGYELQLGTWYQPPRGDMPHEIQLVDPGDSEEVTVNMGKPGRGKGVMGHTETEDRYAAGKKIIDAVDFDENEGGVYDIPQSNPRLREIREDMELPPDFTDVEGYDPNVEIMVPLTENLSEKHIPYHGPNPEDTVVRPFTVPASSLSKRALKRFVMSELTDTQQNVFESAYDTIQRRREDWNLRDLIHAVERHRGLHGNQGAVDRVQRAIHRIERKGWIRDSDDPHCIDWERILTTPDTITVFTASLMDDHDEAAKYLFHSYVLYAFRTELKRLKSLPNRVLRERGHNRIPKVMGVFRELHEIAPNSETSHDDSTIRSIQETTAGDFRNLTAMHRHEGVEVTADTQNFIGEIKKRARVNFNRACLFHVNRSPAENMFKELAGERRDKYPETVTRNFGVGECAVLGRVGTDRSFEMTVAVAPPMSHHFDPDEWVNTDLRVTRDREELERVYGRDPDEWPDEWEPINSGWDLRVHLLDEEYRPASELLEANGYADGESGETDLKSVRLSERKPDHAVGRFAWECLEIDPNSRVILDKLEQAHQNWAEAHGETIYGRRATLCQYLVNQPTPEDNDRTFDEIVEHRRPAINDWDDGKPQTAVYQGVRLSEKGEQWYEGTAEPPEQDSEGGEETTVQDSSEPTEDPSHPALDDIECECSEPEPEPMYGPENEEQVGWKCVGCGVKVWS